MGFLQISYSEEIFHEKKLKNWQISIKAVSGELFLP